MVSVVLLFTLLGGVSLSNSAKLGNSRLEKNLGINLDERRLRMQRLGERWAATDQNEIDQKPLGPKIVRNTLEGPESIVTINKRNGVADYLFQADMNLNEQQLQHLEKSISPGGSRIRTKRQAERFARKWTAGKVHYFMDETINERKNESIRASMKFLEENTCIRFVENSTAPNRIRFLSDKGCYSSVGMDGGEQYLSIDDGCESMGTVVHELMHALGYIHTQSRPDRDNFVTVNKANVEKGDWGNFIRYPDEEITLFNPYEYGSVMHYSADAFEISYDRLTVYPKDQKYLYTMGGDIVSFWDIQMINEYYGCSDLCKPKSLAKCSNNGVPNPNDCSTCLCPLGYAGAFCDQRPPGCGTTLKASKSWKTEKIRLGNETTRYYRDEFTFCTYWITAPENTEIIVRLGADMVNSQCRYGCNVNGIEFKVQSDQQETNPRFCCNDQVLETFTSELNPTPIIAFNRHYITEFSVQYRYVLKETTSTTKTTRLPQKPTPAMTTPKNADTCKDEWETDLCERLVLNDACGYAGVEEKCSKTCGGCSDMAPTSTPSSCENKWTESACNGIAQIGMCTQFFQNCMKSCYQCE